MILLKLKRRRIRKEIDSFPKKQSLIKMIKVYSLERKDSDFFESEGKNNRIIILNIQ